MKKILSIIVIASLALSSSAFAQSTTQHTCSYQPGHPTCSYRPPVVPPHNPFLPGPSHGVSEPMAMLAGLAAVSAFVIARRRNK